MVVASLFKAGKPHFHTNGGELANGYHLFVYDAQTNNPANLYMDAKGKFPYPNPIVLNSRGEPNGDGLYGKVGRKYKLIYKDFTNKTIYTIDEIIVSNVESIGIEDTPDDDVLYGRQNGEWKEIPLSELSETVILEYGDNSTYDDVLSMLNAGKRVLVNVDPFYNNNNALNNEGVQKYPISPYKILLQANVPSGNPYIDFTGYVNGSVVQVAHVSLWNSGPSMPSKINNWSVNDVNPTELARASEVSGLNTRVNTLEINSGQSNFRDGTKTGLPIMKNVVLSGGPGDAKCLHFPERTQEEGNLFILIPSSVFAGFTPSETDYAPLCLIGCNMNSNKFEALDLRPVKDSDGTILGYKFTSNDPNLKIFGSEDTRFDGVNTFRPGSYGLRFRIQNNKTDTQGIMFKPEIATEYSSSIIGAGILAYLPYGNAEKRDVGNYVVRVIGTIDNETGAHAGCFSLGEMLIPSGKNPQILGTLGDAPVPVFGLGRGGPGWYLLEANGGGSENESFVINVTMDSDGSLTSDKTYEEISATFNGGQTDIKCLLKGRVFNLMMVADHQTPWTFQNVSVDSISSSDYGVIDARLTISSTNEIGFSTIMKKLVLES